MTRLRFVGLLAAVALLAACNRDSAVPTPFEPAFAKPGSQPADPGTTFLFPTGAASADLRGDGIAAYIENGYSVYANGTCGISSKIFLGGSGDAVMDTGNPRHSDRKCRDYPRTLTIVHDDGSTESFVTFMNVRSIHNTNSVIPVGQRELRILAINGGTCGWRWGSPEGGDMVWVERLDARTWHVYTQDRGPTADATKNQAVCHGDPTIVQQLSVDFLVVADRDL